MTDKVQGISELQEHVQGLEKQLRKYKALYYLMVGALIFLSALNWYSQATFRKKVDQSIQRVDQLCEENRENLGSQ